MSCKVAIPTKFSTTSRAYLECYRFTGSRIGGGPWEWQLRATLSGAPDFPNDTWFSCDSSNTLKSSQTINKSRNLTTRSSDCPSAMGFLAMLQKIENIFSRLRCRNGGTGNEAMAEWILGKRNPSDPPPALSSSMLQPYSVSRQKRVVLTYNREDSEEVDVYYKWQLRIMKM